MLECVDMEVVNVNDCFGLVGLSYIETATQNMLVYGIEWIARVNWRTVRICLIVGSYFKIIWLRRPYIL